MVAVGVTAGEVTRTMRAAYRRWGVSALAILLGGVFVYAGLVKVQATGPFAENIAGFRLLPPMLNNLLAIGLPTFEILLGCLLIVGWRRRTMAFCALLAGGVFLLALLSAGVRGIPVECGCFGAESGNRSAQTQLWISVGRDLLLMGAASVVYLDGLNGDPQPENEAAASPANERLAKRR